MKSVLAGATTFFIAIASLAEPGFRGREPADAPQLSQRRVAVDACAPVATLSCGSAKSGAITASTCAGEFGFRNDVYTFQANAGQQVRIDVSTATGLALYASIDDSAGQQLAFDAGGPAITINTTIPTTGTWYLTVGFDDRSDSGPYALTFSCPAGVPSTQCSVSGTLAYGTAISSQLSSADTGCSNDPASFYVKAYRLPVKAGETVKLTYDASYPAYLSVRGTSGDGAFRASTGNSTTLTYTAEATGSLTVYVSSNTTRPASGAFTLRADLAPADPCHRRAVAH